MNNYICRALYASDPVHLPKSPSLVTDKLIDLDRLFHTQESMKAFQTEWKEQPSAFIEMQSKEEQLQQMDAVVTYAFKRIEIVKLTYRRRLQWYDFVPFMSHFLGH